MNKLYHPTDVAAISLPVTSKNSRNLKNRPVINLGNCTPSQIFNHIGLEDTGAICILGNPARGVGIAKAMIRKSRKPFLIIGSFIDRQSLLTILEPEWIFDSVQASFPAGNGAIIISKPYSSYLELCEYFEELSNNYFLILHLGGGLQIGTEILNQLSAQQCLIFCDSVPHAIRSTESVIITPKDFLSHMSYLFVFNSGVSTKELIELLPTYQYEKVSNTLNVNSFKSRSAFHPFHFHRGHSTSWGQTRTMEYKKSLFEMDELQKIFDRGLLLLYTAKSNTTFLTKLI